MVVDTPNRLYDAGKRPGCRRPGRFLTSRGSQVRALHRPLGTNPLGLVSACSRAVTWTRSHCATSLLTTPFSGRSRPKRFAATDEMLKVALTAYGCLGEARGVCRAGRGRARRPARPCGGRRCLLLADESAAVAETEHRLVRRGPGRPSSLYRVQRQRLATGYAERRGSRPVRWCTRLSASSSPEL